MLHRRLGRPSRPHDRPAVVRRLTRAHRQVRGEPAAVGVVHNLRAARRASRTAQLLSTGQAEVRGRARVPIRVWVSQSPRHASLQRQWHALYQTRRAGPAASFWIHLTALRSRTGEFVLTCARETAGSRLNGNGMTRVDHPVTVTAHGASPSRYIVGTVRLHFTFSYSGGDGTMDGTLSELQELCRNTAEL